jgi:hypothetical protein
MLISLKNLNASAATYRAGSDVPLYRYCKKSDSEHYYSTYFGEVGNGNAEYTNKGISCVIINS